MREFRNQEQFREASNGEDAFEAREMSFGSPERLFALRQSIEAQRLTMVGYMPKLESAFGRSIEAGSPTLLAAPTGSGKTLYSPLAMQRELGRRGKQGRITILEPRRDATAMSAEGIAALGGYTLGKEVGFATSEDKRFGRETLIRVVTSGIFLRWLKQGRLNKNEADALMLDEVHEPSLDYQQIFGLLKLAQRRGEMPPTLLTSATFDLQKFQQYYGIPAELLVAVEGRSYPVQENYLEQAISPGRNNQEVVAAAARLAQEIGSQNSQGDGLVFMPGQREIYDTRGSIPPRAGLEVLPLYGDMAPEERDRVLRKTSPNQRIIVSTNIAESSVTVPEVRWVVDSCLKKVFAYNSDSGMLEPTVEYISQSEAQQRAGRAGRVAPGKVIRLLTKEQFAGLPKHPKSEISRANLALMCLQFRADGLNPWTFPYFEAPDKKQLSKAHLELQELGLIDPDDQLTPEGLEVSRMPFEPRMGLLIYEAKRRGVAEAGVVLAAFTREKRVFLSPSQEEVDRAPGRNHGEKFESAANIIRTSRADFKETDSDLFLQLEVFSLAIENGLEDVARGGEQGRKARAGFEQWCERHYLSPTALRHIAHKVPDYLRHAKVKTDLSKFLQILQQTNRQQLNRAIVKSYSDHLLVTEGINAEYRQPSQEMLKKVRISNTSHIYPGQDIPGPGIILAQNLLGSQDTWSRYASGVHPVSIAEITEIFPERIRQEVTEYGDFQERVDTFYVLGKNRFQLDFDIRDRTDVSQEALGRKELLEQLKAKVDSLIAQARTLLAEENEGRERWYLKSAADDPDLKLLLGLQMNLRIASSPTKEYLAELREKIVLTESNIKYKIKLFENRQQDKEKKQDLVGQIQEVWAEKFNLRPYQMYGLFEAAFARLRELKNRLTSEETKHSVYGVSSDRASAEKLLLELQRLEPQFCVVDNAARRRFAADACSTNSNPERFKILREEMNEVFDLMALLERLASGPKPEFRTLRDELSQQATRLEKLIPEIQSGSRQPTKIWQEINTARNACVDSFKRVKGFLPQINSNALDTFEALWFAAEPAVAQNITVKGYIDEGMLDKAAIVTELRRQLADKILDPQAKLSVKANLDAWIEEIAEQQF